MNKKNCEINVPKFLIDNSTWCPWIMKINQPKEKVIIFDVIDGETGEESITVFEKEVISNKLSEEDFIEL